MGDIYPKMAALMEKMMVIGILGTLLSEPKTIDEKFISGND